MKQLTLFLCLLITLISFSQSPFNSEDYSVTKADLTTNTFKKDSTANALVIYEYGNSYFDKKSFDLKTEIKRKIKIFNRNGFDNATCSIYLYKTKLNKEKVENIEATTYNIIDGNIVATKIKAENIYEEEYNNKYTIVKFTLPNIKEGSVITYSYILESPFKYKYKGWEFQHSIPTIYSKYKSSIPGNYDYHIRLIGFQKLAEEDYDIKRECLLAFNGWKADCVETTYVMKDISAFIEEDYMTTKDNYLSRLEYELKTHKNIEGRNSTFTKTWKTVEKELKTEPTIGKQLNKSIDLENLFANDKILKNDNTLKKAKQIYSHIQENYTWNNKFNLFKDVSIKNIVKNKTGNNTEINILLHNILKSADIDVKPVLLSTRNNGFATKIYPVISDFNYLIVQATINNKTYFLDATDKYLSFGEIPFRCLNQYGRLLDFKEGGYWVDIKPQLISSIQHLVKLKLNEDGIVDGTLNSKYTSYKALNKKRKFYNHSHDDYINDFENNHKSLEVLDHKIKSKGIKDNSFIETFKIKYTEDNLVAEIVYLDPFILKFFTKNPFKLQKRTYPIDFGYTDSYSYSYEIDLGNTYTILEKPKDQIVKLPNNTGNFAFGTSLLGNKLILNFRIEFRNAIYGAEYYPFLKKFFAKIVDTQTKSLIVLQKK